MKAIELEKVASLYKEVRTHGIEYTHMMYLPANDPDNDWALVMSWMDYDEDGHPQIYGKIAYQPKNSGMQEYDIDWLMPYDKETGEVFDTEARLDYIYDAVEWWNGLWEQIRAEKGI